MTIGPGILVGNNLRLVRILAEGGMGSLWIADNLSLNAQVAVKFVSVSLAASHPDVVARFSREATAAARLRHPNVIQVFDHGVTTDGVPYIVMELLDGVDLGARIQRGPLSLEETARVIGQVARALSAAHARGVVHRDIKPENIFLATYEGETFVKVLDFGIAKQEEQSRSLTNTGVSIGTPHYMSPEQIMSARDVDHRSDLWSLAAVAYHCLTGRLPFDGETVGAVYVAINACDPLPPGCLDQGIPPIIDSWFRKALSRRPKDRFPSAKSLAESFQAAVDGTWDEFGESPKPSGAAFSTSELPAPDLSAPELSPTKRLAPTTSTPGLSTAVSAHLVGSPIAQNTVGSAHQEATLVGTATNYQSYPRRRAGQIVIGGAVLGVAVVALIVAIASRSEPVQPTSEAPTAATLEAAVDSAANSVGSAPTAAMHRAIDTPLDNVGAASSKAAVAPAIESVAGARARGPSRQNTKRETPAATAQTTGETHVPTPPAIPKSGEDYGF